jgi:hypothetical protein
VRLDHPGLVIALFWAGRQDSICEQLVGPESVEQAIEIQSQYAKKAYDTWVVAKRAPKAASVS